MLLLTLVTALWPAPEPPVSERWHAWPVERVFPPAVAGVSPSGARVTYVLVGVAPEASCPEAFQPGALAAGCRTALRATYADSTLTYVVTVGIAVLDRPALTGVVSDRPGGGAGDLAALGAGDRPATVRPVAFPRGAAAWFGARQYVTGALLGSRAPYLVGTAAGYADGRPYRREDAPEPRLRDAARRLATAFQRTLTR
ncbi:hypothetical protein MF672_007235 [Actinomadura sp. ATCC 31491]|uniref:Uncharacterized protein n=1 Tax=Actinomadura luzonensis TaxID=2805427 RepID=A0ABT0FMR0_9ACTN|nr:hypothetical protein [Actinomadura luzonensis]MCK2213587.1 hypothetical protein [Actinomadura luzonensis]